MAKTSKTPNSKESSVFFYVPYIITILYYSLLFWTKVGCEHKRTLCLLPVSVTRQTRSPNNVCRLTPIDRDRASTPPVGQWPAGWQLHTLIVKVLVLERAGEPLSVITTGRRYRVRSLRVKVLLRAMMLAVLSESQVKRERYNFRL